MRKSVEPAIASPSEAGSQWGGAVDAPRKTTSVLSAEDADIRDAAEALAELGRPGTNS